MTLAADHVTDWQPVRTSELQQACRLEVGAVQVWRFSLDDPPCPHAQLVAHLSSDEQSRAARFVFEQDRRRFENGRGTLRMLLGAYLACSPASLHFGYGSAGKPELAGNRAGCHLAFNLAHSQAWALVGVTAVDPVGIDIEAIRAVDDAASIVRSNFSPGEIAAYLAFPEHERRDAFFRCWVRKEAYVKALGSGLSEPLDRFEVSLAVGEPNCLLSINGSAEAALAWTLRTFRPHPEAWAAVAVPRPAVEVATYELI